MNCEPIDTSLEIMTCKIFLRERERETYLLLGISPARNFHNHVQHSLLLIGIQRNVVKRRDRNAILLDVYTMLEGVSGADFADRIRHGGVAGANRRLSGSGGGKVSG